MNRQIVGIVFALLSVCIICVYTQTTTTHSPILISCGEKIKENVSLECISADILKWQLNGTSMENYTLKQRCCILWDDLDCIVKEDKAKCNAEDIAEVEKFVDKANEDNFIIHSRSTNGKVIESTVISFTSNP